MSPEFAKLVNPTLLEVLSLVDVLQKGTASDLRSERSKVRHHLETATDAVTNRASAVGSEDWELAKECLIYWADEVLTRADPRWSEQTFEWEYYGTLLRAVKFYMTGETRAQRASPDVTELWYLAMVLGFEGSIDVAFREEMQHSAFPPLGMAADMARLTWTKELHRQIRKSSLPELSSEPQKTDLGPLVWGGRMRMALGCSLALFLLLLLTLSLSWK